MKYILMLSFVFAALMNILILFGVVKVNTNKVIDRALVVSLCGLLSSIAYSNLQL